MRVARACFKNHVLYKVFQFVICITICLYLITLCKLKLNQNQNNIVKKSFYVHSVNDEINLDIHSNVVDNYFNRRKDWPTSNLGTVLFKNIPINTLPFSHEQENKTYKVLIWRHWNWLKNRHIHNFNSKRTVDPLQECSVKNCQFTGDDSLISSVDAVIVHVQKGEFPNTTLRNTKQRWVFLNDESPEHAFSKPKKPPKLADLSNMFNWSMTYRYRRDFIFTLRLYLKK